VLKRLKLATERNFGRYRCIKSQNYRILQGNKRKLTPSDSITEQIAAYEKIIIHCFISLTVFSQEQKRPKIGFGFMVVQKVLFILEF
jgi:hypothetical protein